MIHGKGLRMLRNRFITIAGFAALASLVCFPAQATSGINVEAGAYGYGTDSYGISVRYYSPVGLLVTETGPLYGTTASYSPTSAPTGLTAISLTAAVTGTSSGSGTASADLSTGILRASAKSDTYHSRGQAAAELFDDVTFSVLGGGSNQIAVVAHLDGTIGSFANFSSISGLSYNLNFGQSYFHFVSQGTQAGFTVSTGPVTDWDSYSLTNVTATGFDFTGLVTVSNGQTLSVAHRLNLACQEGVDCDFSRTGTIALQLPSGVSFTSASGVFLTSTGGGAVPEPASWAMLVAGFGLVGNAMRRGLRAGVPARRR
jgi:hypothetical protein